LSSDERQGRIELEYEERRGARLAVLTVARPARLNTLSSALLEELAARLEAVAGDEEVRLVTVQGAGDRAFIGGADVYEMAGLDATGARAFIRRLHEVCLRLRSLPVPVVACIDGYCLGAGLEVALCCDLRLATSRSTFGVPEVRLGVPTVIEGALLELYVGAGRTRDLVLTGRSFGAREALDWGLVDRVAAPAELGAARRDLLEQLLAGAPRAVRLQKELCRVWEEAPLDHAVAQGIESFTDAYRTDEPQRYMRRFLDRRRD
jgi:enoyl-CoA hydratase/carnithine racemase